MSVPMSSPDLSAAEIAAVNEVLRTPSLSIGPRLTAFEAGVARHVGARYGVGVSSGTTGLHLGVRAAEIADGDLAITSPFSFVASANVLLYERAVPIFVDIDPDSLNLDPGLVIEATHELTSGTSAAARWLPPAQRGGGQPAGRLKAILPVHAFGQPADLDPMLAVAQEQGLTVIEDSCEALGSAYKGRPAGTLGDVGVFAFYPNKQMTTGEGGMLVTNRADWDALFRSLRNQGRDVFDAWLNHSRLGYNYRLDELSAALGVIQIGRIEELLAKRDRVAQWYNQRLTEIAGLRIPFVASTTTRMSWFVYVIRLAPEFDRDAVMAALEERGIPSRPYFSPIHLQPFYRARFGFRPGDFPITEAVARTTLALPFFGTMSEEQVDEVCTQLASILSRQPVRTPPRAAAPDGFAR